MITDERTTVYLNSLDKGNTAWLNELEQQALKDGVPIIRKETQRLIKLLLKINNPANILEVGTAVGFSALLMAEYTSPECRITTIEKYEKRIPIALDNFNRSAYADRITLMPGDAAEILAKLTGSYDMIFMDAAKGQYINFYPDVKRLTAKGGIIVSDNVLQDGDIIESRYAVTRRDRTIHGRMREYLYTIQNDGDLTTTILPVGDGVAISVKN